MHYAQNNYPNVKLGTSTDSIKQDGCALIALCNIAQTDPINTNQKFIEAGDYADGELIDWAKCAATLGLEYKGVSPTPLAYPCIGCTDHYKSLGFPTHYFEILNAGQLVDSLDGQVKPISTYNIISCQNVTTSPQPIPKPSDMPILDYIYKYPNKTTVYGQVEFLNEEEIKAMGKSFADLIQLDMPTLIKMDNNPDVYFKQHLASFDQVTPFGLSESDVQTITDLQPQLDAANQQIATLQAQLATKPVDPIQPPAPIPPIISAPLSSGDDLVSRLTSFIMKLFSK